MAAQRYSRILEAAKLYSAVGNYIQSITDSTKKGQRVGLGKPRAESKTLFLTPFGQAIAATQSVRATCALPTYTAVSGLTEFSTRVKDSLGPDTLIKLAGYAPPRVQYTKGRSATGTKKVSKTTGLPYLSYGGTSTSFPFGKKTDDTAVGAVFEEIKAQLLASAAGTGAIVTLIPEVI